MRKLLIVGFGDIARRTLPLLRGRYRLFALARTPAWAEQLRREGVTPVSGDLDRAGSLRRLAGLADDILHLAPPPADGEVDLRTANLLRALGRGERIPQRLVYISTTGVYGDCAGAVGWRVSNAWCASDGDSGGTLLSSLRRARPGRPTASAASACRFSTSWRRWMV